MEAFLPSGIVAAAGVEADEEIVWREFGVEVGDGVAGVFCGGEALANRRGVFLEGFGATQVPCPEQDEAGAGGGEEDMGEFGFVEGFLVVAFKCEKDVAESGEMAVAEGEALKKSEDFWELEESPEKGGVLEVAIGGLAVVACEVLRLPGEAEVEEVEVMLQGEG